MIKEDIYKMAHIEESSDSARQYFKDCGLSIKDICFEDCSMLRLFIMEEINKLLADKTYRMIPKLWMNPEIKETIAGLCIYVDSCYFIKRVAIRFSFGSDHIYFCPWASGCNRIPFIIGFIKWCDWMVKKEGVIDYEKRDNIQ